MMTEDQSHKFQNQLQITYEELFREKYTRVIALFRELEKVMSRDRLLTAVRDWSERSTTESVGDTRVSSFEEFKDYWKEVSFGDYLSNIVTVDFPHETDSELNCNYTECLYAKTFRDLGAEDLGKIMLCEGDHPFIKTMNPNLKLERTKTLMEGHEQCNHRFFWDE